MPDEDETRDPLAGIAEGSANALRISAPARNPTRDITESVCGEQQVHPSRSARQLLLPDRNLVTFHRRRDQHNQRSLIMGEVSLFLMICGQRPGIVFGKGLLEEGIQRIPLVVTYGD